MNEKLEALLNRLETTKIPRVEGQLRSVSGFSGDGEVCMCPLGHLVDMYINKTPGAAWSDTNPDYYTDPNYEDPSRELGFPTDEILAEFGLTSGDAYRIYRQNDSLGKTPAEVAQFIREELGK